jgi:hypothetical protein
VEGRRHFRFEKSRVFRKRLIERIGFQIEEIRNLLPTVSLPKIRFKFAEVFEEVVEFDTDPAHNITTGEAEAGLDGSSYGFPSQAFIELHDLTLSQFKRVYVEILDVLYVIGSYLIGSCCCCISGITIMQRRWAIDRAK